MTSEDLDPERGKVVAAELRTLGVTGILLTMAEEGRIKELKCDMPKCYCPKELGGDRHFDAIPEPVSDWIPTQDHIVLKSEDGKLTIDNVRLAHRICNRIHYNVMKDKPIKKDLARVDAAREQFSNEPVLATNRVSLSRSNPRLFEGVWAAVQSSADDLKRWLPWAMDPTDESIRGFLTDAAKEWVSGFDRHFTLIYEGDVCGGCSLTSVDPLNMTGEIGYWMRSDLTGKGLMTEAAGAIVDYGFWQEGLHRIELQSGTENLGSLRVAEKLGFKQEGTMRDASRGSGGFYDSHICGLLITDRRPG